MSNSAGVPPSERYPLSDYEQHLWDSSVQHLTINYQDHDPIEQAADDYRLGHAYELLCSDTEEGPGRGTELLAQISNEYMLLPDELAAALEIYRDRLHEERQK